MKRLCNHDTRYNTLLYVENVILKTEAISMQLSEENKEGLVKSCLRAIQGLENICVTYKRDPVIVVKFQLLIDRLKKIAST